jgi:hypothetical protein
MATRCGVLHGCLGTSRVRQRYGQRLGNALGACEVLARLLGHPGYTNAYTKKVDQWVSAHKLKPSAALLKRASAAIDRILADNSELRDLWEESDDGHAWRKSVEDLRARTQA